MDYNSGKNLNEIYDYYLERTVVENKNNRIDGVWKKYERGSNYKILLDDLNGKNDDRNIAYPKQAEAFLKKEDIYIYFTRGKDGVYNDPNYYVRVDKNGKVLNAELIYRFNFDDPAISIPLAEKIGEFSNRSEYVNFVYGIYMTNKLFQKINNNMEFDKEDIRFLHNMDSDYCSVFKYDNPTITKYSIKRDFKTDLAYLFDCDLENIGTEIEDFDRRKIVCYIGNIDYNGEKVPDQLRYLKYVKGFLYLNNIKDCDNLGNLEEAGSISMWNLQDASGLSNFKKSQETFNLCKLKKAKGLEKLEEVGILSLNSLEDANGIGIRKVRDWMNIKNLVVADGFENLMLVGGKIFADNLEDTTGFSSLEYVDGCPAEEVISKIPRRNKSLTHKLVKKIKRR